MKNIVLTGGCGFIGSHTCILLLEQNFNVHVIDNLYNSHKNVIENIKKIVPHKIKQLHFHYISLLDYKDLNRVFLDIGSVDEIFNCPLCKKNILEN